MTRGCPVSTSKSETRASSRACHARFLLQMCAKDRQTHAELKLFRDYSCRETPETIDVCRSSVAPAHLPLQSTHFTQRRAHRRRIGIRPFKRECAAFIGLDWVDATEIVSGQVGTGAIGTTSEHETFAIGRKLRLAFNELGLAHAEKRGNADYFGIRHADDTVLDPAARPASPTLEITFHWSFHALSIGELRAGLGTVSAKALLARAMNAAVAKRMPGPKRSQIQPPSNA